MLREQSDPRNQSSPPQGPSNQLLSLPGSGGDDDDDTLGGVGGPPWWRRRSGIITIAIILLIIVLGAILIALLNRPKPVNYEYAKATLGNISQTVSATGPLQSATYNLIFEGSTSSGKITAINVKVGDKVRQGQVLASLDKTLLQDAVNQDQQAVNSDTQKLNAAYASAGAAAQNGTASVNSAQTSLSNAQNSLNKTQNVSDTTISADQAALDNAKIALNNAKNVANSQTSTAKATRNQTVLACNTSATATAVAITPGTKSVGNRSQTRSDCVKTAQDTYNQTVSNANQTVSTAQQAVTTAQNTLNEASATAGSNNTTAQNTINTAQSGVTTAQTGANVSNTSANASVVAAQATLTNDQAVLAEAQHNLAFADLKAPHDGVVSVINGTVGGQPGVPIQGVSSTASTTTGSTFMQIVDNTNLQIQSNVNESDMANLQVGQSATFTVNAYPGRQFGGTVAAVSPLGQTSSNVVSYPVYINIPKDEATNANLLPNMTANVTITVVQHNNVLVIPVNAVNFARNASSGVVTSTTPQLLSRQQATDATNQARQTLNTLESQNPSIVNSNPTPAFVIESLGNSFVPKPVVLGLTDSTGTQYEVLSGLSSGETFISGVQGSGRIGTGGGTGLAAPGASSELRA